jgi:hypothetical protein
VVERILGKAEVDSSILSDGTTRPLPSKGRALDRNPTPHLKRRELSANVDQEPGEFPGSGFTVHSWLRDSRHPLRLTDGPYRVEHDQSKNLATYHDLLQRFIDHDEEIELRQSEIASFKFPLKLTDVTQVDSKASSAVQLADVMIGAALEAANTMTGLRAVGLDPEALMSLYAADQFIHLLPSIDFEEQRQFRQGTQASAVIDYFAANFGPKE